MSTPKIENAVKDALKNIEELSQKINTTEEIWRYAIRGNETERAYVAAHPETPSECLAELSQCDISEEVRGLATANPNLPVTVMEYIATSAPDKQVKALQQNPNLPNYIRVTLDRIKELQKLPNQEGNPSKTDILESIKRCWKAYTIETKKNLGYKDRDINPNDIWEDMV